MLLNAAALRLGEPHGTRWRIALARARIDGRGDTRSFGIVLDASLMAHREWRCRLNEPDRRETTIR